MNDDDIKKLVDGNVADLKAALPGLDADTLNRIRAAEMSKDAGDARSTAIAAIDDAIGKAMVAKGEQDAGPKATDEQQLQDLAKVPSAGATNEAELQALASGNGAAPAAGTSAPASSDATASSGDGLASGGDNIIATEQGDGEPIVPATDVGADGGGDPKPTIDEIPHNLDGMDLASLESLRADEINGASRNDVLDAIDAAIDTLKHDTRDALELDPGSTKYHASPERDGARLAAFGGATSIAFADRPNKIEHIPAVDLEPSMFSLTNGKTVLQKTITLAATLDPVTITHVMLLDDEGDPVAVCEIPGGIRAGGGREAQFPAGTLIF